MFQPLDFSVSASSSCHCLTVAPATTPCAVSLLPPTCAHSCPSNRAAHCTFGLFAPPNGHAYVRRLYGGGGFGGTERSWSQASRSGASGMTSALGRGLREAELREEGHESHPASNFLGSGTCGHRSWHRLITIPPLGFPRRPMTQPWGSALLSVRPSPCQTPRHRP